MIKHLSFLGWPPAFRQHQHAEHAQTAALRKHQRIARHHAMPRLPATLAVQPQVAALDHCSDKLPSLEEPCRKKAFVQPKFRLNIFLLFCPRPGQSDPEDQSLAFNAIKAANGLSGSIGFSARGGRCS